MKTGQEAGMILKVHFWKRNQDRWCKKLHEKSLIYCERTKKLYRNCFSLTQTTEGVKPICISWYLLAVSVFSWSVRTAHSERTQNHNWVWSSAAEQVQKSALPQNDAKWWKQLENAFSVKGIERKADSHGNRKCLALNLAKGERWSTAFCLCLLYTSVEPRLYFSFFVSWLFILNKVISPITIINYSSWSAVL